MPAYVIVIVKEIIDAEKLAAYRALGNASLQTTNVKNRHGRGTPIDLLEGEPVNGLVLLEFPTMQEAKDWYYSPVYQDALKLRREGAICHAFMLEGE